MTPISLIANLVVVPVAFFILAIALLSLLSTPLLSGRAIIFNNANWLLARVVLGIVQLFAQIPGGHFYVAEPHWPEKLAAQITVLDLGAGAAVHVSTAKTNWLFDCGSNRSYQRIVRDYLHWAGVNRLNALLLTHGDALHIGGAANLLHDFPRVHLMDNPARDRSKTHQTLQTLFKQRGIQPEALVAGDHVRLSNGVTGQILFPPRLFSASAVDDQAYVIRLSIEPSTSVLFMSDSGKKTEDALLSSGLDLRSDILVKGQHYSGQSGSDLFLDVVKPHLIIATSREFPEHERINDQWAADLQRRGIKLFRQDETDAIELKFSGKQWTARAYLTGEIFRSVSR